MGNLLDQARQAVIADARETYSVDALKAMSLVRGLSEEHLKALTPLLKWFSDHSE